MSTYHRLDVPNVDQPYVFSISFVRHSHVLPGLLQLSRVYPFVISRTTNIIEMLEYSESYADSKGRNVHT